MPFRKLLGLVCAALVSAPAFAAPEEKAAGVATPIGEEPAAKEATLFKRVNQAYKKSAKEIAPKI